MAFRVLIARDRDQLSRVAADVAREVLRQCLAARETPVLGLATGQSPLGLYRHLAEAARRGEWNVQRVQTFNLDDYVGLPGATPEARARHPQGCAAAMARNFFDLLPAPPRGIHIPAAARVDATLLEQELRAHPEDWRESGAGPGKAISIRPDARSAYLRWIRTDILDAYGRDIERAGGIDLQIIGVGENGHVAFHEAGIPFASDPVLLVRLEANTIHNAIVDGHFPSVAESPRHAVSMGAALVFRARSVLLLAAGARKAPVLAAAFTDAPVPAKPISYAQKYARRGGDMVAVLDREAAAGILARRSVIEARGIAIAELPAPRATSG